MKRKQEETADENKSKILKIEENEDEWDERIIHRFIKYPTKEFSIDWCERIKKSNKFSIIEAGIENPSSLFPFQEEGLKLPPPLEQFYKRIGKLYRVKDRDYFHIKSLDEIFKTFTLGFSNLQNFRSINDSTYQGWCSIGSELDGFYAIDCDPNSKLFGVVITYIALDPEITTIWRNFNDFLNGVIPYLKLSTPSLYYHSQSPCYGHYPRDRNELFYFIVLFREQAKIVFNIARIIFCSASINKHINNSDKYKKYYYFNKKKIINILDLPIEIIPLILLECGNSEKLIQGNMKKRITITNIESTVLNLKFIYQIIDYAQSKETIGRTYDDFFSYLIEKFDDKLLIDCANYLLKRDY